MPVIVRPARADDAAALAALDTSYIAGDRTLVLERTGAPPELAFSFRWLPGTPREEVYGEYGEYGEGVERALAVTDAFFVAEVDGSIAGLLMVVLPSHTDASEITDLAVDRDARRSGAGRALVETAAAWARDRALRALWVEPRASNAVAVEFYLALGFRISGFNDRMYSNSDDEDPTLFMHLEL